MCRNLEWILKNPKQTNKKKTENCTAWKTIETFRFELYFFIMPYLKYFFIQQPCPKHSDTLCADYSIVPSQQFNGLYFLAIQVKGHSFILHTIGYPVPSERNKNKGKLNKLLTFVCWRIKKVIANAVNIIYVFMLVRWFDLPNTQITFTLNFYRSYVEDISPQTTHFPSAKLTFLKMGYSSGAGCPSWSSYRKTGDRPTSSPSCCTPWSSYSESRKNWEPSLARMVVIREKFSGNVVSEGREETTGESW